MLRTYFSLFLLLIITHYGISQAIYEQSAGLRLGRTSALTFKKFLAEEEAIELLLSGRKDGIQLTTLYQFHQPMEFSFNENFYVYYGLGLHLGYEKFKHLHKTLISVDPAYFVFEERSYYTMGGDAIIGLEYRWLSIPMTLGFDIKPYLNFIGLRYTNVLFWDSAVTFKYVF